jgi:hypothetical protein
MERKELRCVASVPEVPRQLNLTQLTSLPWVFFWVTVAYCILLHRTLLRRVLDEGTSRHAQRQKQAQCRLWTTPPQLTKR